MTLSVFLKIVEIETKLASLFPYIIGMLFSATFLKQINPLESIVFFIAMLIFDMTTTAINTYMDYVKAHSHIYKYKENIIGQSGVSPRLVRGMILFMLTITALLGAYLTSKTGWFILIIGALCCFIGIFYTFGPIPISRMPLGEFFSGFTMGLGIFALTIYVNTYQQHWFHIKIAFDTGAFQLVGNLWTLIGIFFASLPMVFSIANVMLANNLRDLKRDIENKRYTLVYYIGHKTGLNLYQILVYSSYAIFVLGFVFRMYDWPILLACLTFPIARKKVKEFQVLSPEPASFGFAIQNLILINSSYIFGLIITWILQ